MWLPWRSLPESHDWSLGIGQGIKAGTFCLVFSGFDAVFLWRVLRWRCRIGNVVDSSASGVVRPGESPK
jgi:hypothetical protein